MTTRFTILAALVLGLLTPSAFAQAPTRKQQIQSIDQQLGSADAGEVQRGLTAIDAAIATDRFMAIEGLTHTWLQRLARMKHNDEIADLAQRAMLSWPINDYTIVPLLRYRIHALIAAGRPAEALADARSAFNVANMERTSEAMALVWEALQAAHPNDTTLLLRFRQEQAEHLTSGRGVSPVVPSPTTAGTAVPQVPPAQTVMSSIRIDPAPYEKAINDFPEDGDGGRCRANLLLLAGRAKDARDLLERFNGPAATHQAAAEDLARCMKAEDGSIARATQFILSLRPQTTTGR